MAVRLFLARLVVLLTAAFALAMTPGCGRSNLVDLDDEYDSGPLPDGATPCNSVTCPTGCCSDGQCVIGTATAFCGTGGAACSSCLTTPGTVCDPTQRACVVTPVSEAGACNEQTCPGGCCDDTGICQPGTATGLCGSFGNSCTDCSVSGTACDPNLQQCAATTCGAECKGCCQGGSCVPGTQDTACGTSGTTCSSCTASGQSCAIDPFGGGLCEAPGCNATTCAGCCSAAGCVTGTSPSACGNAGDACVTCAATGEQCVPLPTTSGGLCTTTACSGVSCFGCCDVSGLCRTGTAANACGTSGDTCSVCNGGNECVDGTCQQAAACGPSNCVGCCDDTGSCVAGSDNDACGSGGLSCMPCGTGAACLGNVCQTSGACNATNCNGCCTGNQCFDGTTDAACGSLGIACTACQGAENCTSGQCLTAPCGPSNCGGCCDVNNQCDTGDTAAVCGSFGVACAPCGAGMQCIDGFCDPTCGPGTCSGCCVNGVCAVGSQNTACGSSGSSCVSCPGGQVCAGNQCVTPAACDASNCTGCCDPAGACEAGFLDTACGSGGSSCVSCSAEGATCDVDSSPRVCTGADGTCPAPYASCPSGVAALPVPTTSAVCTTTDLNQVGSACVAGPSSAGCESFFTTEKSINATCGTCLAQFDVALAAETGVLLCAEPFLTGSCAAAGACFENCEQVSCNQCAAGSAKASCQGDVEPGACNAWYSQLSCATTGVNPGGQFCDPDSYATFGAWLQAVGTHYCAN